MRFETSQSTPSYLNRGLQLRMLSFVGMIALAMFLLNSLQSDPDAKPINAANDRGASHDPTAGEVANEEKPLFNSSEFEAPPADIDLFERPIERTPQELAAELRRDELGENQDTRERETARRHTRFNKRLLTAVKDNTLGIRRDEAEAYYQLVDHVRHVSPTELERAAISEVQYVNLMTEPNRFRGEPVTIQGDLWRLYEFEAGSNTLGLTKLYEAWIFTGDSGNHPYRVICTSLPHTLAPGENLRKPVRATGYFFKREGYQSQGGMHVAPTLIAPSLASFRASNSMPPTDAILPYMMGVATAVGLALLVTLLAFTLNDRRSRLDARQRVLNAPRPSFEGLDVGPIVSVEEALGQLAEQRRQADLQREIASTGHDAGTVATEVLYRRDPDATVPPPVPATTPNDDELNSRPLPQANVLNDWASREQVHRRDAASSTTNFIRQAREQTETERVLDELEPPSASAIDDAVFTPAGRRSGGAPRETTGSPSSTVADERAAREQLQSDRITRELELRERLQQQRTAIERERLEQLEREGRAADEHRQPTAAEHFRFDRAERPELASSADLDETAATDETGDASAPEQDLNSAEEESPDDSASQGWFRNIGRRANRRDRHRRDGR